jgi:O-antigen ligase
MAFLIPVAVAFALYRGTAKAKIFTVLGLGLAIPPAVAANNRGMLLALVVTLLVVAVRLAAQGRLEAVFGILVVAAGAGYVMLRLGLLQSLTERAEVGRSSEGRGELYLETFQRTLKSPILGYGAPRDSFTSEITVGTQGAIWATMFCYGFVGLALLLYFLFGAVVRTWHLRSPSDLWLNATLISTCVMSAYYGLEGMLPAYGILVAMMLRDIHPDLTRRPRAG